MFSSSEAEASKFGLLLFSIISSADDIQGILSPIPINEELFPKTTDAQQ